MVESHENDHLMIIRCSFVSRPSTHTIEFTLGPHELRYWNAASRDWKQDTTTFDIWVGGSLNAAHMGQLEVSS